MYEMNLERRVDDDDDDMRLVFISRRHALPRYYYSLLLPSFLFRKDRYVPIFSIRYYNKTNGPSQGLLDPPSPPPPPFVP